MHTKTTVKGVVVNQGAVHNSAGSTSTEKMNSIMMEMISRVFPVGGRSNDVFIDCRIGDGAAATSTIDDSGISIVDVVEVDLIPRFRSHNGDHDSIFNV